MKYKLQLIVFFLTFVIVLSSFSQQSKPRIAVMPFNHIGVSKNDTKVVTGLFETGLVKTNSFNVIEQEQINEILSVQAFTLTGCTDDACAIEFGKILAAEQVVLGVLSTIGGKFVLNVKIIDVELGSNIRADNVETGSIADMTKAAELLAFKLAGLTYSKEDNTRIANEFRDVFIETSPTGADIYINGINRGVSPGLFERVPVGNVLIEAKKGSLYGVLNTRITDKTNSLEIRLEETYGNLLIKSSVDGLDLFIDENFVGKISSGFYENISVGKHSIVIEGNNQHWEEDISIIANKTITVEADPKPYGFLQYLIQDGVTAELFDSSNNSFTLENKGDIPLFKGEYIIKLSGDNFESKDIPVTIKRGDKYHFTPVLEHTKEYIFSVFSSELKPLSELLVNSAYIKDEHIQQLKDLQSKISASRFEFDELKVEVKVLLDDFYVAKERQDKIFRLKDVKSRREEIEEEIKRLNKVEHNKTIGAWVSTGSSVLSAGLFGLFSVLSNSAYDNYLSATISANAVEYKNKVQLWDTLKYVSLGTAAAGAGLSAYLFLSKSPIEELNSEYISLGIELARLEGELQ